jgi:low affinity Fe/Cu permease
MGMDHLFSKWARYTEHAIGSPWAFIVASGTVIVWAVTGPFFGWSDTWQLVINTSTTVITYLIVFLIQATQTRDTLAIHVKLDELLRAVEGARTGLVVAEDLEKAELNRLLHEMQRAALNEKPSGSSGDGS